MAKTTVLLQMDEEEKKLLKEYANLKGISLSELLRSAAIAEIEDFFDMRDAREALTEFEADPVVIPFDEVFPELE